MRWVLRFRIGDIITHPDEPEVKGLILDKFHPRRIRKEAGNPFYCGRGYYLILNITNGQTEEWEAYLVISKSRKEA